MWSHNKLSEPQLDRFNDFVKIRHTFILEVEILTATFIFAVQAYT